MRQIDVRHIAWAVWLLCVAGLVAVIGNQTDWGRHFYLEMPTARVLEPEKLDIVLLGEYSIQSMDKYYSQTLERPLFVPTRRPAPPVPPPPPPPPPPKPTMQKGQFQMVGVLILPDINLVWLRDVATGKTRRVEKGQTINGILIKEVEAEAVVLTQYDDVERLVMKVAPSPTGNAAAGQKGGIAPSGRNDGVPAAGANPTPRTRKFARPGT